MNSLELASRLIDASWQLAIGALAVWLLARRLSGNARGWLWRGVAIKAFAALFFLAPLSWLAPEPVATLPSLPDVPVAEAATQKPVQSTIDPEAIAMGVWAAGAFIGFGILAVRIRRAEHLARTVQFAGQSEPKHGYNVIRTRATNTPLILGIRLPTILLPDDPDTSLPLAHEMAHADRHDLAWHVALSVFRAIFWFHPLAWLAAHEHRQACEEASDALAIERTGANPTDYAKALLTYASRPFPPMTALASSAPSLRRRIHQMHRRHLHPAFVTAITVVSLSLMIPARLVASAPEPASAQATSIDERASHLLQRPSVKKEIGLSKEQEAKIQAGLDANYSEIKRIGQTMEKMKTEGVATKARIEFENSEKAKWYAENARIMLGELTDSQRLRLREIALRNAGPLALGEKVIGEQAGLKPDKIARIRILADEAQKAIVRLSSQRGHEEMERTRLGLNLAGEEKKRFLRLSLKIQRVSQAPESQKYLLAIKLPVDSPERKAEGEKYRLWMLASPDQLTPAENAEYFKLFRLAAQDPTRKEREKKYRLLYIKTQAQFNKKCDQMLTPTERLGWQRLLGKPFVID